MFKTFKDGILDNNPVLVQLIGLCSVLAITTSVENSIAMGIAVTIVLVGANIVISLLRNFIPDKIRIPAFIVIIATFVTVIQMVLQAYMEPIYESLGIFLPLIVVNCIILARAEAFAFKNGILPSIVDGIGMGIGYTLSVVILGGIREILGNGSFLGFKLFGESFKPIGIMVQPPGAFILLGIIIAVFQSLKNKKKTN